jgi:N-acetylglucosamine-6-phosphate deacetylase
VASAPPHDENDSLQAAGAAAGYELPSDEVLAASNMYSTAEACLLAWMSHHMAKAFPNLVRVVGVPPA